VNLDYHKINNDHIESGKFIMNNQNVDHTSRESLKTSFRRMVVLRNNQKESSLDEEDEK
jgi:hypothetical protein